LRAVERDLPVVFFAANSNTSNLIPRQDLVISSSSHARFLLCNELQFPKLPRTNVAQTRIQVVITHENSSRCKHYLDQFRDCRTKTLFQTAN
jgi:hypothetical protein